VEIFSADGAERFGRFEVAYVKDSEGREVTDAGSGVRAFTDGSAGRVNASSPIHHVEIVCTFTEYEQIRNYCGADAQNGLILIRREPIYE